MQTTTDSPQPLDVRSALRWLLAAVWLVGPAWSFWQAFELLFTLFGPGPSAAEEAAAARWLVLAGCLAVGAPVAALALGGRRRWGWALGLGLLLSAVFAVAVTDLQPAAPPPPVAPGCVVYSGSDNPCPGG